MWKKRHLIEKAFGEIALAGYEYDITPEEQSDALGRLDAMMATWSGPAVGIRLNWNATVNPDKADPDQDCGLPDWANEGVYLNLAVALASSFGKQLLKSTTARAKQTYDALLSATQGQIPQMQPMANLPAGAGYKRYRGSYPFVVPPRDRLTTGQDGLLDFNGPASV